MILLAVFSLLSILSAPSFIRVKENFDKTVVSKNEVLLYQVKITNHSFFIYSDVDFKFYNTDIIKYTKKSDELNLTKNKEKGYLVKFPYRGIYNVGIEKISVIDFLGLFNKNLGSGLKDKVLVFPEKIEGFVPVLDDELLYTIDQNVSFYDDNYNDVSNVRKYLESDSMKKIHWKLSAKRNELLVKNFENEIKNKIVIFMDSGSTGETGEKKAFLEDKITSLAASSLNYCVRNQFPTEFIYADEFDKRGIISNSEQLDDIMCILAGLNFEGSSKMPSLINNFILENKGKYNLICISSKINEEISKALGNALFTGNHVVLYLFSYSTTPEELDMLRNLRSLGVDIRKANIQ